MTSGRLAALAAIALYVLAFPPVDAGPLAFLALAPWCVVARRWRGGRLFLIGSVAGAAILALGCAWIRRTHPLNLAFMVVPESLFFGAFALLLRALHVTRGWPAIVALPLAFTGVEVVRGRWPLDGFPWLTFGYSQHAFLEVVQLASVAGVHGVTFLLALVSGALVDAAAPAPPARRLLRLAPAAALVALVAIGGRLSLGDPGSLPKGPRMLVVQPAIPQRLKDDPRSHEEILARHFELIERALAGPVEPGDSDGPVELAVWSETMVPVWFPTEGEDRADDPPDYRRARAWQRDVLARRWFTKQQRPLLAGIGTYVGPLGAEECRLFNSAILFDAQGRRVATYDKKVLVPGGEYLPWIDHFPAALASWIRRRVLEMAGFAPDLLPGARSGVLDLAQVGLAGRAGLTICFEFAYPHLGRELVKEGADFLVNLSNEAWFPDSAEFDQSTAMSVFRAAETRRAVVRCANSGTSGWIDPWGRTHLLELDGRRHGFAGTIVVAPPRCDVTTPYVRFGEWVGAATWAAIAALLVIRRRSAPAAGTAVTAG